MLGTLMLAYFVCLNLKKNILFCISITRNIIIYYYNTITYYSKNLNTKNSKMYIVCII